MTSPLISVLIDTYNHEKFISDAVNSVLAQDFPAYQREILVVDDGSTDATPEILRKFEGHIRVLRKTNGGQASAFNLGIPECKGGIVCFLDGDDWWATSKLSAMVATFEKEPAVGLVGHSITEVLSDGSQRSELVGDGHRFRIDSVEGAKTFRLRKSFLGTSRMAYRTDLLRRIGPVPETLVIEADEFLFTLGALFSEVALLREPLTFYRLHGENLFQIGSHNPNSLRRKHDVLVSLAEALRNRFADERVPGEISSIVIDAVQTEAAILRISLGEGTPLENFRAEVQNYDLHHGNASWFRRILKYTSLLPALFLPAPRYNALKESISSNSFYVKIRKKIFPNHPPKHVERIGDWNS